MCYNSLKLEISCFSYPGEEGKRAISLQDNLHVRQVHSWNYIRTEKFQFYLDELAIWTSSCTLTGAFRSSKTTWHFPQKLSQPSPQKNILPKRPESCVVPTLIMSKIWQIQRHSPHLHGAIQCLRSLIPPGSFRSSALSPRPLQLWLTERQMLHAPHLWGSQSKGQGMDSSVLLCPVLHWE